MKHNFHVFRKNKKLGIQTNFIFVDTESKSIKINDNTEILTFKLGCAIYWNKDTNETIRKSYYNVHNFWLDVEKRFNNENKQVILYAHNTQFDFKMLNGFSELSLLGWKLTRQYVKNKIFILAWKKDKYTLHIWDTMNYVPKTLKQIGKSIGLPKLEINFKDTSNKQLEIYCKRDTEIIYQYIKRLIEFLEINDLSKLKSTAGSLSLNTFRHKFYDSDKENQKIHIHDWKRAIKLERASYRGGITDLFKFGTYKDLYKLDINSMYPGIMKERYLPSKLIAYRNESLHTQDYMKSLYNHFKRKYLFIMDITIEINKDNAYILNNFKDIGFNKSVFAYGKYRITLCQPEIRFIEKYGTIKWIHQISIYKKRKIFTHFVDFFFNLKVQYKKQENEVNEQFCKLMLNTQYGKWGQRKIIYKEVEKNDNFFKKYFDLITLMIESKKELVVNGNWKESIIYLGSIVNECEVYIVNGKLYYLKSTLENAKDSFVAISSFITSYARMELIRYIKIAERNNVYYCDTDSLFVNQSGYNNLEINHSIHKFELGKLKKEGKQGIATFYAPKFYDFNESRKCKGVKKDSVILLENNIKVIYEINQWEKHKTSLKKGNLNKQIITRTEKTINKIYTKGKIDKFGYIHPYSIIEIIAMIN